MSATLETGYSTHDVVRLSKLTYRQVDYMDRTGYLRPSITPAGGSGQPRRYSYEDVHQLVLTRTLLEAGVSWSRLRKDRDPIKTARRLLKALGQMVEMAA